MARFYEVRMAKGDGAAEADHPFVTVMVEDGITYFPGDEGYVEEGAEAPVQPEPQPLNEEAAQAQAEADAAAEPVSPELQGGVRTAAPLETNSRPAEPGPIPG